MLVGRGQHSHAYTHSVQMSHHVWLNLSTLKFYCLPDNYEIIDASLEDIKVHLPNSVDYLLLIFQHVLKPVFSKGGVASLDISSKVSISLDGTKYIPGVVGLNNIKVLYIPLMLLLTTPTSCLSG